MKKVLSVGFCLLLVIALAISVFAAGSTAFSMHASQTTLYWGDTVTLTASCSSSAEADSYGLMLSYDSSVFELVSYTNTVSSAWFQSFNNGFAFLFQNPTAYSGPVGTVTLKVKDNAPVGTYTVSGSASVKNIDEVISASGCSVTLTVTCDHTYGAWSETDNGHSQTCSKCGTVNTQDHKWNSGTVTVQPTCSTEGKKEFSCSVCSATKEEPVAATGKHTFGNLIAVDENNHKDTCSVCNKEVTEAHTWNKGVVTKKATCKEEGERTYTCTGCKTTKTEVIPVLDTHAWSKWQKVDDATHNRTCSVCEKEETGNHSYNTYWSKDRNNHFHECSVCKDQKDVEKHTPGPEATEKNPQICTVCKYVIKPALEHIHEYAEEWTTDEDGHWYICSGCEEKGEYADHDFENACDPDCGICGFTRETAHNYGDNWVTDGENHYHECTGCGDIQDKETHIPGAAATETEAQTCTVCGYELAPALGTPETEPADIDIVEKDDFPWWILLIVAATVVAAALFFAFKKKK